MLYSFASLKYTDILLGVGHQQAYFDGYKRDFSQEEMGGNTSHYFCKRDAVSLQNLEIRCFKDDAGRRMVRRNLYFQ